MRTAPASTGEGPSSARGQAQGAVDRMLDVVPWYNGLPAPERAEIRAGLRLVSLRKGSTCSAWARARPAGTAWSTGW